MFDERTSSGHEGDARVDPSASRSIVDRVGDAKAKTEEYQRLREVGEGLAKVSVAETLVRAFEQIHEKMRNSGKGVVGLEPGVVNRLEKMIKLLEDGANLSYVVPNLEQDSPYHGEMLQHGEGEISVRGKSESETVEVSLLKSILGEGVWDKVIKGE